MKNLKRITMIVIFVIFAFVYLNCLLMELWPTLYPESIRNVAGFASAIVIVLWFVLCVVILIKKYKRKNK